VDGFEDRLIPPAVGTGHQPESPNPVQGLTTSAHCCANEAMAPAEAGG
jgi:hypothetical protein